MARLWRNQGKRDEARELLAPVCGWFTEGFETRDVKEAKALLFAMRRPTAFRQCEMTLMAPGCVERGRYEHHCQWDVGFGDRGVPI